jgi:hypothetical protein
MLQDNIFKKEEYPIDNTSYDDSYNNQIDDDIYLSSKDSIENTNNFFEIEFKKVFNDKDAFAFENPKIKEEEKEKEKDINKEKIAKIKKNKKRIFKLICSANNIVNKRNDLKSKKYFLITSKNNYKNYSFDEIILNLRQLNKSSKSCLSNVNKLNILNLEYNLVLELKNRILNKYEENKDI